MFYAKSNQFGIRLHKIACSNRVLLTQIVVVVTLSALVMQMCNEDPLPGKLSWQIMMGGKLNSSNQSLYTRNYHFAMMPSKKKSVGCNLP